jgi:hypothetical protein
MDNEEIHRLYTSINSDFSLIPANLLPDKLYDQLFKIITDYVSTISQVLDTDKDNNFKYVKDVSAEQLNTMIIFHKTLLKLFQDAEMYELCINVKKINEILESQLKNIEEKNTSGKS